MLTAPRRCYWDGMPCHCHVAGMDVVSTCQRDPLKDTEIDAVIEPGDFEHRKEVKHDE